MQTVFAGLNTQSGSQDARYQAAKILTGLDASPRQKITWIPKKNMLDCLKFSRGRITVSGDPDSLRELVRNREHR